jgi:hypothetical protein
VYEVGLSENDYFSSKYSGIINKEIIPDIEILLTY